MTDINDWISVSQLSGESGTNQITVNIEEYKGLEDRTHTLKVVSADGLKEVFVTVQQKAFKPSFTTNKQIVSFTQEVLSQSLQITSNCDWVATCDSWITLSQIEGSKGTTNLEISVDTIASPTENRNGSIQFYFDGQVIGSVTVKQEFEVIFEVSTTSIDMTDELTATINITSNVDWYCNTDATWVYIDIVSGFGDKTITVTAQTFNGQDRNAYINFYVGDEVIKTITVYQYFEKGLFYIEPYNNESITFTLAANTKTNYNSIQYFDDNNGWVTLKPIIVSYMDYDAAYQLTLNKRTYFRNFEAYSDSYGAWILIRNGLARIGGNIEKLLGETKVYPGFSHSNIVDASNLTLPSINLTSYCYAGMFKDNRYLTNTPILPATTLAPYCYQSMFEGCTSLVNMPELPSTSLAIGCYKDMFKYCNSIITAQTLPSTTLASACYMGMFEGCSSLKNAPSLPAITLTDNCYRQMFYGCTSLLTTPMLPATILADYCYSNMFAGCTSLERAYQLNATTLKDNCYEGMFYDCSSLVVAPTINAVTLAIECCRWMFAYCYSLQSITLLTPVVNNSSRFDGWCKDVPENGTFKKLSGADIPSSIIPYNWTVVEI